MRILDERQQVKDAIESFCSRYCDGTYAADSREVHVGAELKRLDPDTATAKDIANLIGNDSWVKPKACGECGKKTWGIIEIGEEPCYESRTAYLCGECLAKGASLAGNKSSNDKLRGRAL